MCLQTHLVVSLDPKESYKGLVWLSGRVDIMIRSPDPGAQPQMNICFCHYENEPRGVRWLIPASPASDAGEPLPQLMIVGEGGS